MDKTELTNWALANGWQMLAGCPSLTRPSAPKEAIVRLAEFFQREASGAILDQGA